MHVTSGGLELAGNNGDWQSAKINVYLVVFGLSAKSLISMANLVVASFLPATMGLDTI